MDIPTELEDARQMDGSPMATKRHKRRKNIHLLLIGIYSNSGRSQISNRRLSSLIENLKIFVVRVNAAVIAPGGFAGNAEFGQVFHRLIVLPSFLPSFKGITLFRHFAPGPRPRHSMRRADFKSRNKRRIISRQGQ